MEVFGIYFIGSLFWGLVWQHIIFMCVLYYVLDINIYFLIIFPIDKGLPVA